MKHKILSKIKKIVQLIINFFKTFSKRQQFIPTIILVIATLIIVIIGYELSKETPSELNQKNDWKTKNGVYVPVLISSYSPIQGPTSGKNTITILGKGFSKQTQLFVGSTNNINQRTQPIKITKVTSKKIEATLPPHPPGKVDIFIVYNGTPVLSKTQYRYVGPEVKSKTSVQMNSISPQKMSIKNPVQIKITGTGFGQKNTVLFGKSTINNISSSDGKILYFDLPSTVNSPGLGNIPLKPGKFDVAVKNNNKESNFITFELIE